MDFNKLKLWEGTHWDAFLHQDQTALGRLYFWNKGEESDLLDIPINALLEFYELGGAVKTSLVNLFQPDMFNYQSLNNRTNHLHIHMIPRYSKKIDLFDLTFEDISFGKRYERNSDFTVDEDTLIKIKDKIKGELVSI